MKLTASDVGKFYVAASERPMQYLGESDGRFLFVYRDPPRDHLAYRDDQLWTLARYRPTAATLPRGV